MKHSRAAEENTFNIDHAARQHKPFKAIGGIDSTETLHIPLTRDEPEAGKVDMSRLNGRDPLAWEQALIEAARMRERAREWRP